jgi:hypothetical protein
MKKALLSCMAVGALSALLAVSAFAAEATYDEGRVSVANAGLGENGGQMTVLVISEETEEKLNNGEKLDAADILYIDQEEDADDIFQNMGVKGGELADGKYVVKIGGTNVDDIIVIPFEVGSQSTVVRGDANGDTVVDVNDATSILLYTVDQYELDGDKLTAADANLDNIVDVNDGTTILLYTVDQYELTSN